MEKGAPAILFTFKGNYGLPSIDPKCLQLIFLLKLHGKHNIEVKSCGFCTYPKLPYLRYNGNNYRTTKIIAETIDKLINDDCDKSFSTLDKSRIKAYKEVTNNTFDPAFGMFFWGLEPNSQHLIKLYGIGKYFPFRIIFNRRMQSYTQSVIFDLTEHCTFEEKMKCSIEAVDNYLSDLSNLLDKNRYLIGDNPSSLDAYVCGYLAPLLVLKFPNNILQSIIKSHKKVVKYVENFVAQYGVKYEGDNPEIPNQKAPETESASIGLILFAGFVAGSTMLCFGIYNDIIKF